MKVEKVGFVTCIEGCECRMHGQDLDDCNTTVNEAPTVASVVVVDMVVGVTAGVNASER